MWTLGTKLRLSGLAANCFTCWAISVTISLFWERVSVASRLISSCLSPLSAVITRVPPWPAGRWVHFFTVLPYTKGLTFHQIPGPGFMALNKASIYACFQEPRPARSPPLSDSSSNPSCLLLLCPQIMLVFDLLSLTLRKLTHSEVMFSTSTPWISRFPCQDQIHISNAASSFLVQTCPPKPSHHYTSFLFYTWLLGLDSTIYPPPSRTRIPNTHPVINWNFWKSQAKYT